MIVQDSRAAYEQAMQTEGYQEFQITELEVGDRLERAGERDYYLPATYLAPLGRNKAALGFDLSSSPVWVVAIEPVRDSGDI